MRLLLVGVFIFEHLEVKFNFNVTWKVLKCQKLTSMPTATDWIERRKLIARRLQTLDSKGLGDFGVENEILNWV